MMYPFLTLEDSTEIVHSDVFFIDGIEQVKVYIEKPVYCGFNTATCYSPDYKWESVEGFSEDELGAFKNIVMSSAHLIFRFAREGGIESDASNF